MLKEKLYKAMQYTQNPWNRKDCLEERTDSEKQASPFQRSRVYTIQPAAHPIHTVLTLPGSKSITNRALILSALARGESILNGVLHSEDTTACIHSLKALKIDIEHDLARAQCRIKGEGGNFPAKRAQIWCQDSGTTVRFLLAACAAAKEGTYHFSGTPQLQARPLESLVKVLQEQGAEIDSTQLPLTLNSNRLAGGNIFIRGNESSQFISALLMIAPHAQKPVTLTTESLVSSPYVTLTMQMMKEFGLTVSIKNDSTFLIQAPDFYTAHPSYSIEPDLSTASYFFAAAAVTHGKITINNIDKSTCKQGDIVFLDVLNKMGCHIEYGKHSVTVQGTPHLKGQTVDMSSISDTMMTLACIAPFADSPTTITHIGHVRYKESDRIAAIVNNLRQLGIETQSDDHHITIFPGIPKPGKIESYADHRIAMSFSLIGLRIPGILINGMECVSKTCPEFTALWEKLIQ